MFVLQKTGGISGKTEYQGRYKNGQIEFTSKRSDARIWESIDSLKVEKKDYEAWVEKRIADFPHLANLKYSIVEFGDLEDWIEGKEKGTEISATAAAPSL